MLDLTQSLQGRDLGHLRIIAELWGVEFSAPDAKVGLQRLTELLLDRDQLREVIQALPEKARAALDALAYSDGMMLWSAFERRFGAVREVGPAKRDRERPYLGNSTGAAEALWYRGLVGRAFFDAGSGLEEFAYIPADLLALMPALPAAGPAAFGRAATPAEKADILPASDRLLDDACTYLAALRMGRREIGLPHPDGSGGHYWLVGNPHLPYSPALGALEQLLAAAGLLDGRGRPRPEPVRDFLQAPRGEALTCLARAWIRSAAFNDLRLAPSLESDGEWRNDPQRARRAVLDFLSTVPGAQSISLDPAERPFWSLAAFVAAVHRTEPDFQRSAGEYDSWYLRRKGSDEVLRGFENWDAVDGELIRFIIGGPLHWLGIVDLAAPSPPVDRPERRSSLPFTAFRFTRWATALLNLNVPKDLEVEDGAPTAGSDGRLYVPRLTRRSIRYQTARFSSWERITKEQYIYRLTPTSLAAAREQGLQAAHLIALLRKNLQNTPPSLATAIERWEAEGTQARIDRLVVLRVKNPELLQALRASRLSRFLGEPLGPTAVIVRAGAVAKVCDGLTELGYLSEVSFEAVE